MIQVNTEKTEKPLESHLKLKTDSSPHLVRLNTGYDKSRTYIHAKRISVIYFPCVVSKEVVNKFWRVCQTLESTVHKTSISKVLQPCQSQRTSFPRAFENADRVRASITNASIQKWTSSIMLQSFVFFSPFFAFYRIWQSINLQF